MGWVEPILLAESDAQRFPVVSFCHHELSTYLMHFVPACYFCHRFLVVQPLVISPIGLDSILASSHGSILLGLLCPLSLVGTGALPVSV